MGIKAILPLLSPAGVISGSKPEHKKNPPIVALMRKIRDQWAIQAADKKASKGAQKRAIAQHLANIGWEMDGLLERDDENNPIAFCRKAA